MYRRTENMRYYKHLYLTEGLEKKKEKMKVSVDFW